MTTLTTWRVWLFEAPGDKHQLAFDCYAEDSDHAYEQAENAYPGCVVRIATRIPESDYMGGKND